MCGRDDDPSMIDVPTDPLAALLCDLFPTAERSRWPFSVQLAAERLRAAGVTVASPSDPADPLREAAQEALDYLDMAADAMPTVLMGARGVRQTLRAALEDKP